MDLQEGPRRALVDLRVPEPVPHPTDHMPTNAGFRPQEMQRRQFQQATATAIDQHATILKDLMAALNRIDQSGKASREFVADLSERVDQHIALHAFVRRTFWGRLHWLLTGR